MFKQRFKRIVIIKNVNPIENKLEAKRYLSVLLSAFNLALKNVNLTNFKYTENFNEFIEDLPVFVQIDDFCIGQYISSDMPDLRSKVKKIGDIQGYLSRQLLKQECNWMEY